VLVNPDDIHKTGFTTPFGNYEFVRMAMSMMSASSTVQRLMDEVLQEVEGAKTYLDDTFAFTPTFEQHLLVLEEIFRRCLIYNVKMSPKKCRFGVEQVVCLGHLVQNVDGRVVISPVDDKISAILGLARPHDCRSMKRFLGMTGHYRKYIDHYATLAAPLDLITHKRGQNFVWSAESAAAYDALTQALCSAPVLAVPDWDQPFILTTDWSRTAIGAVLAQVDPVTGDEHPVAFTSRVLTSAESNYAATEGECLAAKWAMDKFRYYLSGRRFVLRTDHAALKWLDTARFTNSKLERWAMALQEYDFEVEYIKGSTNVVADHLSQTGQGFVVAERSTAAGTHRQQVSVGSLVACCSVWPENVEKQSDLDSVVCGHCQHAGGADNMAICSHCSH
jgi:hypothetical protein